MDRHETSPSTLTALMRASAAINSSLDLAETLQTIARTASEVTETEASCVLLLDRPRNKLVFKAATGSSGQRLLGVEFDADYGIAGKVLRTGQPALVTDVTRDESFFKGIDEMSGFTTRGIVAAPLIKNSQIIGVVEVLNKIGRDNFTEDDVELLQVFANLAASGASNAQSYEKLKQENNGLLAGLQRDDRIIGASEPLQNVLNLAARVAGSDATALILGETGTGKELISQYIHRRSNRAKRPFIALHCAALPETLLESELFGHEKGAFTGAVNRKVGRFELADGGTLFLDEIGDISPSTQIKLLRVLQEREFVRLGGTESVTCDVRIIAATNRDLTAAMKEGSFREDLYYRLNVFPIKIPPLRERRDDIPLLVDHFITLAARQMNLPVCGVSDDALAALVGYDWPGNIRELRNIIERAVLLCDQETIGPAQLPPEIAGSSPKQAAPSTPAGSSLHGYEKAMIAKALAECDWNQTRAAEKLGISRDNLRYRIKKYGISKPQQ